MSPPFTRRRPWWVTGTPAGTSPAEAGARAAAPPEATQGHDLGTPATAPLYDPGSFERSDAWARALLDADIESYGEPTPTDAP